MPTAFVYVYPHKAVTSFVCLHTVALLLRTELQFFAIVSCPSRMPGNQSELIFFSLCGQAIASGVKAIAFDLLAIASGVKAIASDLLAIVSGVKAIASDSLAIAFALKAIAFNLLAIANGMDLCFFGVFLPKNEEMGNPDGLLV